MIRARKSLATAAAIGAIAATSNAALMANADRDIAELTGIPATDNAAAASTSTAAEVQARMNVTFADLEPEPAPPIPYVSRLDQAQDLPEADADLVSQPASERDTAIAFFKSRDGRTMRVVCVAGRALAAQEVK